MAQRPTIDQLPFAAPAQARQVDPMAVKDLAERGQAKVSTLPAQTERGEASLAIPIAPAKISVTRPSGISHKNKLALAGQNIIGDKDPKKLAMPQAKTEDTASRKNPFSQKRPTFGPNPGDKDVRIEELDREGAKDDENSDDSDDFNEFYMKNNPRFAGAAFTGVDSSVTNSLQQTGQNKFNMYNTAGDEAGRGSFNHEEHFGQQAADMQQLNRNVSQSHLTPGGNEPATDAQQKEVELKALGENSQMFQDSILQSNTRASRLEQQMQGIGATVVTQGQMFNTLGVQEDTKVNVNLEDVVLHEAKLATILECVRQHQNASLACEDWWDLTESSDLYGLIHTKLIRDIQLRQLMIKTQKYETIAIGIVQFYHQLASEQLTVDTKTSVNVYLKNLMHYIHQSFLVAAKFIASRIVDKEAVTTNVWVDRLKKNVAEKMQKPVRTKADAAAMLRGNLTNSDNILKNIIKPNLRKQFFQVLEGMVTRLPLYPNEKIRDMLYNIEQFKFDAMLQPELRVTGVDSGSSLSTMSNSSTKSNRTASGKKEREDGVNSAVSKRMIKDSDKSSGTNNLVGGGGTTSLTGKNPFAVLKASAIAASQKAVFPNNFTNLPKVSPPFLPPLDPTEKDTRYTLVLDLDETLIHNVEYGQESFFLVRPGCVQFIELMAQYYEIVIFTAALQEYADQVVDQIDVNQNIKYRLYRQHTSQNGPFLVKDLSLLGRNLQRTIIIDNISDNFILQPDNGIFISTWYDDMQDNFLKEISLLLVELVEKRVPDVRVGMRSYRDQILRQISQNGQSLPVVQFK